jgi:predicted dehydrogenase
MANLVHQDIAVEDWGMATINFANGVVATLEASWTVTVPQPTGPSPKHNAIDRRVMIGTNGIIVDDRPFLSGQARLTQHDPSWVVQWPNSELYGPLQPDALVYLISCLETRKSPVANMAAARDSLAVALACYESARAGGPVPVHGL